MRVMSDDKMSILASADEEAKLMMIRCQCLDAKEVLMMLTMVGDASVYNDNVK